MGAFLTLIATVSMMLVFATSAGAELGRVVSLGDSASTGTGLGPDLPGSPALCNRTDKSYSALAMQQVAHQQFISEGCDNSSTSALYYGWAAQGIRAQFEALNGQEEVVFLTIGINNAGLRDIVENCLVHTDQPNANRCTSTYVIGGNNTLAAKAAGIATSTPELPSVGTAIDQIHVKSPNAKIFLVGYPRIAPPDGAGCKPNYFNLTPTDGPVFGVFETALNDTLRDLAAGHDAYFVDNHPATTPHNACLPVGQRWTIPFSQFDPTAVGEGAGLHVNITGANAVASKVLQAMADAGLNLGSADSTPPTIAINAPTPNQVFNVSTTTLNYNASDNVGIASCTRSNNSQVALSLGVNTISVTCSDAAGNSTSASVSVTYTDSTPPAAPTVTRTSPTGTPTKSTSQTIAFGGEAGGSFQCQLNAAGYAPCAASPITLSGLADGVRAFSVKQTDAAGNTGAATTVTWTVDTTPPSAPLVNRTSPTADPTNSTSQSIAYSGAETGGTYQCKLDAAAFVACPSSPLPLTALSAGTHTLAVRQTDAVGNVGAVASITWTIDLTPPSMPTVTRTVPSTSPTTSTSQTISFGGEPGGTFQCKLDAATFAACPSSPLTLSALGAGSHTYSVVQTDAAGNVGSVAAVSWAVDLTPPVAPTVTRTVPSTNPTTSTSQTISFSGEPGGTFQCKLDAATYSACSSPITRTGLATGSHQFSVTQTDAAGNVSVAGVVSWTVNFSNFSVSITTTPADLTKESSAEFGFVATVASGTTYECRIDSGAFAACTSPRTYSGLADGLHSFSIRALNGSQSSTEESFSWRIDSTPPGAPTLTRSDPVASPSASSSQVLTLAAAESGGELKCRLDGAAYSSCPANVVALNALSEGIHTYSSTQTDAAGNTGSAATVAWVVDTIPPEAPIVTREDPAANPTSVTSQTIAFIGEPGTTRLCKLDAASYSPCSGSPVALAGLTVGDHIYSVVQTDAAGNSSPAGTVSWTVAPAPSDPTEVTGPTVPPAAIPRLDDQALATVTSAKLSSVRPQTIVPNRIGGSFSLRSRGNAGVFNVSLSGAATAYLRLVRVSGGRHRASSGWTKLKLNAGRTPIYLSGRASGHALPAGSYSVQLALRDGSTGRYGRSFQIKR